MSPATSTSPSERLPEADGRSTRWAAHRTERRAELCRAARRAVHHRGPDLSMDEMAAAMGTSKSIVYRYFTDKSGLQAAVGIAALDEFADALAEAAHGEGPAHERIHAMVEIYVHMLTVSPNVYRFVTRNESQPGTIATFISTVTDYVAEVLREVLATAGADTRLAPAWAAGVVGFVRGTGEHWLTADAQTRLAPEPLVAHISGWLWDGARMPITSADVEES